MVLVVLIVLWGIVLIPPAWQSHAEARRARQADAFRRRLSVLAPAPDTPLGRWSRHAHPFEAARAHVAVMAPRNVVRLPVPVPAPEADAGADAAEPANQGAGVSLGRADVLRRRQRVLVGLMAAAVASLAAATVLRSAPAWAVHGVALTSVAAYLAGLRHLQKLALERRAKVRYLPAATEPASQAAPAADNAPTGASEVPAEDRRVGYAAR